MLINFIKTQRLLFLVIFLGLIFHFLISLPSGSYYCFDKQCGLYFWGAHEHDGIWHLAVINTAFKKFPPQHPVFAGENLTGYNFLLDFVIFLLTKTGIPAIIWYFKILPIIWFFLIVFLTIKLSKKLKKNYFYQVFLLFFILFGSSFGYFFTLFHKKTLIGSSASLAMQAGLTLVNLQFAYSLIFFLTLLLLLLKKEKSTKDIVLIGLTNFIILGLKFYGGIISVFITLIYFLVEDLKKNSFINFFTTTKKLLITSAFFLASLFIFYQPLINKNNSGLVFSPFSIAHSIIEEKNLFYLPNVVNSRYFLYSVNPLSPRLLIIELFTAFLFVFFNLGTRFLGILFFLRDFPKRKVDFFNFVIFLGIIFSFSLSLLFIQKGIWWNTIQFSYYGLFLANFLVADTLSKILKKRSLVSWIFVVMIIILTLPENYDIIRGFIPGKKASYIPKEELEALDFLKKQKEGIVLSLEAEEYNKINNNLRTAFISAFSRKITYLGNKTQVIVTSLNFDKRLKQIKEVNCAVLEKINYIYLNNSNKEKNYLKKLTRCKKQWKVIFNKNNIQILKVI